jgi:predicted choloylglycine hydrolase
MFKRFMAVREDEPGDAWRARFAAGRDEAARWYLGSGRGPPPSPVECRAALRRHMPELVPHYDEACALQRFPFIWDHLVIPYERETPSIPQLTHVLVGEPDATSPGHALVGDDNLAHCILSHYRPPPIVHGCSQAIWLGDGGPALVRNYDFPLDVVSDRFELTAWSGHRVIAKAQRPWGGCLDGMNEDGLVASITDGGSGAQGLGFSVILLLRYVLETCSSVARTGR